MSQATSMETGVTTTTTRPTGTDIENMKASVPTMVTTPVKSCVSPWSRPSPTWSASFTTRESRSPCECASTNESGRSRKREKASMRRSRTVSYVSLFVQ